MLKAVRFDQEEHKELIDYIEKYRDKKNKPNHSEAIRFLMLKGLESLNFIEDKSSETSSQIDVDNLKKELLTQIMDEIKFSALAGQALFPVQPVAPVVPIKNPPNPPPKQPKKEENPKPKLPANSNPLLANILNNSQR